MIMAMFRRVMRNITRALIFQNVRGDLDENGHVKDVKKYVCSFTFNEICGGDLDDNGQFQRLKSRAHCYVERHLLRGDFRENGDVETGELTLV